MNQQNNNQPLAVLPRRSRRLATFIPASHWISIGYLEADANAMERLQNDMKRCCDGDSDSLILSSRNNEGYIGPPPHHDMIIPHWRKLAKALNGRSSIEEILINSIPLPVSVLDIVLPTFQTTTLSLYQTGLGMSVAGSFSNALKNHPTMNRLSFIKNGQFNNTGILKKILEGCTELEQLIINGEALISDSEGADRTAAVTLLAEFICSNNTVKVLRLGFDNISDNDTLVLASALKKNTHLRLLDLGHNDITEQGDKKNLLKALFDPTSMDSIIESNHTCIPYSYNITDQSVVDQRPLQELEVLNINGKEDMSIQQKIKGKAVLAFCGVDGSLFDLLYLNDLPLQLMPRILELIQRHTEIRTNRYRRSELEKDALSRLFHTLRGWELPLLFENLHNPANEAGGRRKRRKTRR